MCIPSCGKEPGFERAFQSSSEINPNCSERMEFGRCGRGVEGCSFSSIVAAAVPLSPAEWYPGTEISPPSVALLAIKRTTPSSKWCNVLPNSEDGISFSGRVLSLRLNIGPARRVKSYVLTNRLPSRHERFLRENFTEVMKPSSRSATFFVFLGSRWVSHGFDINHLDHFSEEGS